MAQMIIPADRLSDSARRALIEEYVTREGTDYGHGDYALEDKVRLVEAQLARGEVVIVFDTELNSANLVCRDELPKGSI